MTRYALLVRGINVGGKNKVVMAELRQELTNLGLEKVESYINSGNIFFASIDSKAQLVESLELKDEVLYFGKLGIFWGKFSEESYSKTVYHKYLLKVPFYRHITIRNAKTFDKIGQMLKK
ncbi:phosphopentomutase [Streptococcus pneumoniae]|uniref:Phosphopentomutase n=1 Tax=Streptococcus pneumoniae TaxID=1313 RepID=A0AAQ3A1A9_STREE|nr:DUF1697 domain-containing protein [Streptococcus pneumoniae]MDD0471157.1 DUF1697 domain-containing protein [Streptococcus pneumoniae]MDS3672908.1 DUF1697 domain-containing protein [Streptococcus pneumoniae]MDS8592627.1 DUF1697 domain-containing protein [Streptococcus pneumoniae]MDS8689302.1 DUF1697 domain-containing protein [Streptococcus pneumoniae]VFH98153.1 phosphopentomutase [Streptococcus pneumoniae]